jgi:LytS/YehU family sensor histidine kinase
LYIFPINFFEIGVLLEATVFGFGLGYRLKISQDERNAAHKAYVEQIEINQQIQANIKNDLERQIVKRTNEILAIQNEVEIHREMQLRTNFEKRISELEMQALRAQMNPHFLFNGLNSLKNFIIKNNNERAVTYLNRFSKLLRMILQLSRSETISLAQELEALKLYVFIEQERLDHKFSFEIIIDPSIRIEDVEIPPLMLQPHIENAIWHGLMPKESGGWVRIDIQNLENKEIKVSIQDNGVGRNLKSTSKLDHKPLGHKITQDRIELHNKIYSNKIHLEILDLVNQNGEAAGTQVIFIIKPC